MAGAGGFVLGAIIGSQHHHGHRRFIYVNSWEAHVNRCYARYATYNEHTDTYIRINEVPKLLTRQPDEKGEGDFWVDGKAHQVHISEAGHEKLEGILSRMGLLSEGESLYAPGNIILMHHLNAALRAHTLFHRDQQYVVQNGEVIIVDEFTGRMMPGRR